MLAAQVIVPLGTLYTAKEGAWDGLLRPLVGPQYLEANRLLLAGGLAVAAVNLVVALFLVSAWQEKLPPSNHRKEE